VTVLLKGETVTAKELKDRVEITNASGLPGGLTKENFGKVSMPRNPLLFSMLHRMNLVEKIGSGILRMKTMMEEQNLKEPDYEISENFFTIRFYRKNIDNGSFYSDTTRKSSEKSSEKTTRKIIKLLKSNPDYSTKQLANMIGISDRAVEKKLAKLKKDGVIKHIGPAKGRYWEVAEP
jgi:ATP-dependent DNA helicase RecG